MHVYVVCVAQFGTGNSLNTVGYVYVPTACQKGASCVLHVNFHGCQQTLADIGTQYVEHVGLNEWAEANNIIVLYPQVSGLPRVIAGAPHASHASLPVVVAIALVLHCRCTTR